MHDAAMKLAFELLRCPSVTPDEAGAARALADFLAPEGFAVEREDTPNGTTNLWITHGSGRPLFVFAGHVDVVPPGDASKWTTPPFEPAIDDGRLRARGAADMKGSDAAAAAALREFVRRHPDHAGTVAMLITSDEEGDGAEGTRRVVERLRGRGVRIDWCIVGEPSCSRFGDTVKNGRRGSLNCAMTVRGKQGHVAYPHLAANPVHMAAPFIAELAARRWDEGDADFGPTTCQVSNIHAGVGADNVIPAACEIKFNFRYNTTWTAEALEAEVRAMAARHGLAADFAWKRSAEPFVTPAGRLTGALSQAVRSVAGVTPQLSTSGGTSDARFICRIAGETVEFGPTNASIHSVDESIGAGELPQLADIYLATLESLWSAA
ncbi:MAG: succinyl-diaminopimelate desuccinylase [Duodenibacillus sp.]|nr:succinyl-diaminopimelate desuccinylase [Duodenibacillus sp.]